MSPELVPMDGGRGRVRVQAVQMAPMASPAAAAPAKPNPQAPGYGTTANPMTYEDYLRKQRGGK